MSKQLKTGDKVQVLAGDNKGKVAKIVKIDTKNNQAMLEGIGLRTRKIKPSYLNPKGGKKEIHNGIHFSNLRKVEEKK